MTLLGASALAVWMSISDSEEPDLGGVRSAADPEDANRPPSEPLGAVELSCDHPYVPSVNGMRLSYEGRGADLGSSTSLELVLAETRRRAGSELEQVWRVAAGRTGGERSPGQLVTRCEPGVSAEEPWAFPRMGVGAMDVSNRWRWPADLSPGIEFGGDAVVRMRGSRTARSLRIGRRHEVVGRERIVVPAGAFEAVELSFVETSEYRDERHTMEGTMWVARDVGLVRVDTVLADVMQSLVLDRYEVP